MSSIVFDAAARLNLVLWGDPQISPLLPERLSRFAAACVNVKAAEGRADALLIAGDIAEFGRAAEYDMAAECLKKAAENTNAILCCTGNHDVRLRPFRMQRNRFRAFLCGVPNAAMCPLDRYWFAAEVRGYPFIVMGADRNSFESAYISRAQLRFIDETLAKAEAAGKPAFVLNHQPLNRTNGLPVTWEGRGSWRGGVGMQSDALRKILTSHGDVFYLTGHLHYCTGEYNVENCRRLHMIAAQTVGCENHGPVKDPGQGFVLSLYEDRLTGTAWDFMNAVRIPENVPNARFTIPLATKRSTDTTRK